MIVGFQFIAVDKVIIYGNFFPIRNIKLLVAIFFKKFINFLGKY